MNYNIMPLAPEVLQAHLPDLLLIDKGTMGEKWENQHFLLDLPGKWECSWIAFDGDKPVGFVIASMKPEGFHVHRIAVASSHQRRGLGTKLLQQVARCALRRGIPTVTLRVSAQNKGAIEFYHRLGFHRGREETELLNLSIAAEALLAAASNQEKNENL